MIASDMPQPEFKNLIIGGFSLDEYYGSSQAAEIEQQMQHLQDQARAAMMSASIRHRDALGIITVRTPSQNRSTCVNSRRGSG